MQFVALRRENSQPLDPVAPGGALAAVHVVYLDGDHARPALVLEQHRRPDGGWEVLAGVASVD